MKLTFALSLLALVAGGARVARAADKCGAHQHVAVEKNDDEGGTVKRCVCDEGWDANGPAPPCKKAKPGAKKPTSE